MPSPRKQNASTVGGASIAKLGGGDKRQTKTLQCSFDHINKKLELIQLAGLRLRCTSGDTQLATLPKVLSYFGSAGLNTYEAVALGYARVATRILELKDVYVIDSVREDVIAPDGMFHKNVARYILRGKRKDMQPIQQPLDLGAA